MRAGSLFSGVGGLDLGLHRAGFQHEFFCESDPWRRSVLAHHWPGVPIYEDVRLVGKPEGRTPADRDGASDYDGGGQARAGIPMRCGVVAGGGIRTGSVPDGRDTTRRPNAGAPALDLLCGGFPCQDLSVAGNRAGLAGERSGLFHEFARIIDALRPRHVLIENVPGLLSSNGGRDFGIVLGTLADLGYGVAWRTLDSRFFGVPQRRRRVFILAADAGDDPRAAAHRCGEILAVGTRCTGHSAKGGEARPDVASALGGSVGAGRGHDGNPFDWGGRSSLSGLGNGGPDDKDAQAGRLIAMNLRGRDGGAMPELDDVASLRAAEGGSSRSYVAAPLTSGSHPNSNAPGRRKEDDVNLVPLEPQTFDWQMGGSWTEGGKSRSWMHDQPGRARSLTKNKTLAVWNPDTAVGVRRLTPTECERLQSWPDGWTDPDGTAPDSRRYAACGDGVTSNVSQWIGERLMQHVLSATKGAA